MIALKRENISGIGYLGIPKQSKVILVNPLIILKLLRNSGKISKSQYRKAVRYGKTSEDTKFKMLSLIRSKTRLNNKHTSKRVKSKPSTFLLLNGYKLIINNGVLSGIIDKFTTNELQNALKPLIDNVIKKDLSLMSGKEVLLLNSSNKELPPISNEGEGGEKNATE